MLWDAMFDRIPEPGHRYTFHDLLSGNLSLRAELFARVGGFDTAFPNCGGEDFELGLRLLKLDVTLAFAPDAIGDHHETRDLKGLLQRKHQEGRADVLIAARHPEILPMLPLSNFEQPFSRLSRILRSLAFKNPKAGDALTYALRRNLKLYERARMRSRWRRTVDAVLDYWYWRGVAEEVKTPQRLTDLLRREQTRDACGGHGTSDGAGEPDIEINLDEGLEAAERLLDEKRPTSARLRYGKHFVGQLPAMPGAERLRGAHLRPILAKEMGWALFEALATERGIAGANDLDRLLAVHDSPRPSLTFG